MQDRPRVLHVVESFGSGVATALDGWIGHSHDRIDHAVVGFRRRGVQIGDGAASDVQFIDLPAGLVRQTWTIWRTIRRRRPDIVHAHSTLAGLMVRTAPGRLPPVVYSPHCFGFERTDLSAPARATVRMTERLLGERTAIVAACGTHEAELARRHAGADDVVVLPAILPAPHGREVEPGSARRDEAGAGRALEVATVGRISPQKDPGFLIDVATRVESDGFRFVWIGGGPPDEVRRLEQHGIEVTGWMPRDAAIARLADADVYVHTAAWEGMPLTVLEAMELGLPIVARSIPPLAELGLNDAGSTPGELATSLRELHDADHYRALELTSAEAAAERQESAVTADDLVRMYRRARPPRRPG